MSDLAQGIGMTGGGAGRMFRSLGTAKRIAESFAFDLGLVLDRGEFGVVNDLVREQTEARLAKLRALPMEDGP